MKACLKHVASIFTIDHFSDDYFLHLLGITWW